MKVAGLVGVAVGVFAAVFLGAIAALRFDQAQRREAPKNVVLSSAPARLVPAQLGAVGDFRASAKRALESAVSIETFAEVGMFRRGNMESVSQGSGVIVDSTGHVVTNNHVVRLGRPTGPVADRIVVTLSDGRSFEAQVIGTDPKSDLAVLKVKADRLTPIPLGDSSQLEVGQWVMAVGNPLGLQNSVTLGIVSSLGRVLQGDGSRFFVDGIQTDAAINSGNSGGALVDQEGNLVGINSSIAIASRYSTGNIGIGFAIPVNRMKEVFKDIVEFGRVRYGVTGIIPAQSSNVLAIERYRAEITQIVGAEPPRQGLLVADVEPGLPASRLGIQSLNVITGMDGKKINDLTDFLTLLGNKRPGETISLDVWAAGKTRSLKLTLAEDVPAQRE